MNTKELEGQAVELLFHIWRGIDADFKSKYKREIWQIFEGRVLLASKQNGTLKGFATQLTRSVQAELGRNEKARGAIFSILNLGYDEDILNIIRNETPYLILCVKDKMQTIKEESENE